MATNIASINTNASNITAIQNASTNATNAANSATAAQQAQAAAELAADNFEDLYLGAKSADPTVDNDGDALTTGDLFLTSTNNLRVYNGSAWEDAAVVQMVLQLLVYQLQCRLHYSKRILWHKILEIN